MKYEPIKSQIEKNSINLRNKTLTYKNQILLNKTKHRDIKNEYIHIDIRTFNVSLVLRYLTSDKHHAHMYIVSLFENDEHNVFDTCSTEIKFQKKKVEYK